MLPYHLADRLRKKRRNKKVVWPTDAHHVFRSISRNMPFWQADYGIHISTQFRYIYVETPKVACSTIKYYLQQQEWAARGQELLPGNVEEIHRKKNSALMSPSDVGEERFFELLKSRDFVKFCFVRHPYTRLISCYLNKMNDPSYKKQLFSTASSGKSLENGFIDFRTFIQAVCNQPAYDMNPHWRIQACQTFHDVFDYDFIGRFEDFENNFLFISNKIFGNESKKFALRRLYATGSASSEALLTDDLKQMIKRHYADDFRIFGYSG